MSKSKQKPNVERFFNAVDERPLSSLYAVCDLMSKQSEQAKQDLNQIAQKISAEQLKKIIKAMTEIESSKRALQDKAILDASSEFKIKLMSDEVWLEHLAPKDIIALSANDKFCLYGLIALTRKHAIAKNYNDPFKNFDFDVLQSADAEHIPSEISDLIIKIRSLPLEDFKVLAKSDIQLARTVLRLLQSHPARFEMGEYFLTQHTELKNELFANWQKTKESIALTKASESKLSRNIEVVAKKYPEFSAILKMHRIKKDAPDSSSKEYDLSGKAFFGFGSLVMGAALVPKYMMLGKVAFAGQAACAAGLSAMASPLIAPTLVAFVSGYMAYKCEPKLVDSRDTNPSKKPLSQSVEAHKKSMEKPC